MVNFVFRRESRLCRDYYVGQIQDLGNNNIQLPGTRISKIMTAMVA